MFFPKINFPKIFIKNPETGHAELGERTNIFLVAGNIDDEREASEDEAENENPANTEKIVQENQEAQSKSEEEQVIFRPKKGQANKWGGGKKVKTK